MTPQRDPYAKVGKTMRESMAKAIEGDLSAMDLKVYLSVLWLTGTYSRFEDRFYLAQLAKIVYDADHVEKWQIDKVGRSLKKLAGCKAIYRDPPRRGPNAERTGPNYRISMRPIPGATDQADAARSNAPDSRRNDPANAPDQDAESAPIGSSMRPESGDPPRSSSEESSEESVGDVRDNNVDNLTLMARSLLVGPKAKNRDIVEEAVAVLQKHDQGDIDVFRQGVGRRTRFNWPSEIDKALKKVATARIVDEAARRARGERPASRCATCDDLHQVLADVGNNMIPCPDCPGRADAA